MDIHTTHRTTARLAAYLDDVYFPCSRQELLRCAEDNEAPDALLDAIEDLPDQNYWSISDIMARIVGHVQPPTQGVVTSPAPVGQLAAGTHAPVLAPRP